MRMATFLSLLCSFSLSFTPAFGSEPDAKDPTTRLQTVPYFAPAAGEGSGFDFHQQGWSVRFAAGRIDLANEAGDRLHLRFPGSDPRVVPVGEDRRRGVIHDYRGKDRSKWRRSQPTFGTLRYPGLYPGIDLVYRLDGNRLKSEFLVAAGADPGLISLEYENATSLKIDEQGALGITSARGALREKAPEVYQEIDGERRLVESRYQLEEGRVSFQLEAYEPDYPLTIDPELEFFFIGGSNGPETAGGIGLDAAGNTFIAGTTFSSDFPTAGSQQERQGQQDAFVVKLDGDTREMIYSVLIGGVGVASDTVTDLAVDGAGNTFITGHTFDFSFPTTENAPQPDGGGGQDIFIAKFDPDGLLLLSTFLGGELSEFGGPIALDRRGNVYLAGTTNSTSFPTTADAFQSSFGGGSADVVVAKLNNAADTFLFSSYLGGSEGDFPSDLAIAVNGDAYLVGTTFSTGLGTTGSFQETLSNPEGGQPDAFLARIGWASSSGPATTEPAATVQALTYLGGSGFESGLAVALNTLDQVSLSGLTTSPDLPLQDATKKDLSGSDDAYVCVLTPDLGSLLFSTYFGGSQSESFDAIVALADGSFVAVGSSSSTDLAPMGTEVQGQFEERAIAALLHYFLERFDGRSSKEARITFNNVLLFGTPLNRLDSDLGNTVVSFFAAVAAGAFVTGSPEAPSGAQSEPQPPRQLVRFVGDTREEFPQQRDVFLTGVVVEDLSTAPPSPTTVRAPLVGPLFPSVEGATPDTDFFSAIAFTNLSTSPLTVHLAEQGESLRVSTREIAPGAQLAQLRRELFGGIALESVWADLGLSEPAVSSFFQFGTLDLSQLDGGVALSEPSSEFVLTRAYSGPAALRGQAAATFVGLHNPNTTHVTLRLSLVAESETSSAGASPAPVEMTISPRGVVQQSLAQIFGRDIAGGYVKGEVTSGGGIFAFQVIQPTAQSTVFGLGLQEAGSASTLYSAQLASVPGLFTNVNLINLSDSTRQLTLTALDKNGANLVDPVLLNLSPGEQFSQDAGELFKAPATAPQTTDPANFVGSLKVDADGEGVVGDVVFGGSDNLDFAAALALQSQTFLEAVFSQVANVPGFFTGLAFFNPGPGAAAFVVEVYAADGTLVGSETLNLPGGQRRSALVDELGARRRLARREVMCLIRTNVGLIAQMLFGATSEVDGTIKLFSAVPPTVILQAHLGSQD